jgi:hypothetical protein
MNYYRKHPAEELPEFFQMKEKQRDRVQNLSLRLMLIKRCFFEAKSMVNR